MKGKRRAGGRGDHAVPGNEVMARIYRVIFADEDYEAADRQTASLAGMVEDHPATGELLDAGSLDPCQISVRLSSLLPAASDDLWFEAAEFERAFLATRPTGAPSVVDFLAQLDDQFSGFAPVFGVGAPRKTLVESFNDLTPAAG